MKFAFASTILAAAASTANAYFLMGIKDMITIERLDPIVNPGTVSGHVHGILGGSNFGMNVTTAQLRESECTSTPIKEDKSNYWFPLLYFQWKNGSVTNVDGGAVVYYLFDDTPGTTTPFPDDFRMISGNPVLRSYDANSFAQQAISFLCLDFDGTTTRHTGLPEQGCASGVRSQINFPSCWDGKNTDSPDHKSHVAFKSTGPDTGSCTDPKFPVAIPRIFMEMYWSTQTFDSVRSQAMNPNQPFVFAHGDPTGYGYHADYIYGWDSGVLKKVVDECNCNPYGDPTCCAQKGIFTFEQGADAKKCYITKTVDEQTTGTLPKLPGNNPIQPAGKNAVMLAATGIPAILAPVHVYSDGTPPANGKIVRPATTGAAAPVEPIASAASSSPAVSATASVVISSAVASPTPAPTASGILIATPLAVPGPSAPIASMPIPVQSSPASPAPSKTCLKKRGGDKHGRRAYHKRMDYSQYEGAIF